MLHIDFKFSHRWTIEAFSERIAKLTKSRQNRVPKILISASLIICFNHFAKIALTAYSGIR